MSAPHHLFVVASTRESGTIGNTEWLARQAAQALPAGTTQAWQHLARMALPPFVDQRHSLGSYPLPRRVPAGHTAAVGQRKRCLRPGPVHGRVTRRRRAARVRGTPSR